MLTAPRVYFAMAEDGLFFRQRRRGQRDHPRAGRRDRPAGRRRCGHRAVGHLRPDPQLRRLGRLHLLRPDRRCPVRLPPPRSRQHGRASRCRGHPLTTGLFVVACATMVVATVWNNPLNSLIGYAILARGCPRLPLLAAQEPAERRMRAMQSDYMHWAKFKTPVRYQLTASEVPHFRLDRFPIGLADLDLDGASHPRYAPLREAIAKRYEVHGRAGRRCRRHLDGEFSRDGGADRAGRRGADRACRPTNRCSGPRASSAPKSSGSNASRTDASGSIPAGWPACDRRTNARSSSSPISTTRAARLPRRTSCAHRRACSRRSVRACWSTKSISTPPFRRGEARRTSGPQFVCTNSLTKVYGLSGLRCGWILAEPALAERMWRLNDLFGVNQAHQAERLACIAFEQLDEVIGRHAGDARTQSRAVQPASPQSRDDLDCMPAEHGITAFPALDRRRYRSARCPAARALRHRRRPRPLVRNARPFPHRLRLDGRRFRGGPDAPRLARWTTCDEARADLRIFPPARRGQSLADNRARLDQSLHPARRGRAVGSGDRRQRQHRDRARCSNASQTPQQMVDFGEETLREAIKTIGLFNTKAKNVIALSQALIDRLWRRGPADARRAADASRRRPQDRQRGPQYRLRRGDFRGRHPRLSRLQPHRPRARQRHVDEVEAKLEKIVPEPFRRDAHHWLILHGRYICKARLPECWRCPVIDLCRYQPKTLPPDERVKPSAVRSASPAPSKARTAKGRTAATPKAGHSRSRPSRLP